MALGRRDNAEWLLDVVKKDFLFDGARQQPALASGVGDHETEGLRFERMKIYKRCAHITRKKLSYGFQLSQLVHVTWTGAS